MAQRFFQKYTIVCFFEPQKKSNNFSASNWPLHFTMLDTFKTDWPLNELSMAIRDLAANTTSFDAVPASKAMLGVDKDVPVKLLRVDADMLTLHNKLLNLADKGNLIFNTPEFVGDGFLPHATDQKGSQVTIGKAYRLKSICLIDMFPGSDHRRREIVDTFPFKDAANIVYETSVVSPPLVEI